MALEAVKRLLEQPCRISSEPDCTLYRPPRLNAESWLVQARLCLVNVTCCIEIAHVLFMIIHTSPFRLGKFAHEFNIKTTQLGKFRYRDLLPMALPTLENFDRWRSLVSSGGHIYKRTRKAAHSELWTWLSVFALNYEYCGRMGEVEWAHQSKHTLAQRSALDTIKESVSYFLSQTSGPKNFQTGRT